jgi:sulfite reductase beta subunit-like hemoprotein
VVACASIGAGQALLADLAAIGLITTVEHPAHGVITCIGRAGCWQTELDTLALAADIIADRVAFGGPGETVHVSGCSKSCACHDPVAVTLLGRDDSSGFDMVRQIDGVGS